MSMCSFISLKCLLWFSVIYHVVSKSQFFLDGTPFWFSAQQALRQLSLCWSESLARDKWSRCPSLEFQISCWSSPQRWTCNLKKNTQISDFYSKWLLTSKFRSLLNPLELKKKQYNYSRMKNNNRKVAICHKSGPATKIHHDQRFDSVPVLIKSREDILLK